MIANSFIVHAILADVAPYLLDAVWWILLINGIRAALPDLIPLHQTIKGNWGDLYKKTHKEWKWMWFVAPDHLLLDKFAHKKEGGWKWWVKYFDYAVYLLTALHIILRYVYEIY